MSVLNKALFLLIIILFINHLTNGEILITFKRIFKSFSCSVNKMSGPILKTPDLKPIVESKAIVEAKKVNKELKDKMKESFNNMFVNREQFDDLFIKPNNDENNNEKDSDYDLIPSEINL